MIRFMEKTDKQRTDVILHGHFYQPPRENPLVDIIPKQSSASPYADWNERIYDDCYRANAYSRYLDANGRVRTIVNNYEHISFNFGPTLLTWMKRRHPETYERILEADRLSLARLGHGNAMAQSYNHTILPLATVSDMKTQISWGLDDFQRRFGRDAEGLWLPETAIQGTVIDLLVEGGVKFVILSPMQCAAIEDEQGLWKEVNAQSVLCNEPFLITGQQGKTISAFFYHSGLASGISFGEMLHDADAWYRQLLDMRAKEHLSLIHAATDGEVYGHHKSFGDMALAALIQKVQARNDFFLTNYGEYLERHPARFHARLLSGEEDRGTSWSCPHGVSRWYKDCGCTTGGEAGWRQSWRTPLRTAFDELQQKIDDIYEKEVASLTHSQVDPGSLLAKYGQVISDALTVDAFFSSYGKSIPSELDKRQALAELLEGQQYKHYMFTSCGWFFSDISGLEARQNIHYAIMAARLYQRFTQEDLMTPLLDRLQEAKSNRRREGTGKSIAVAFLNLTSGEAEAAAYFLMNRELARPDDITHRYGKFRILSYICPHEHQYACELVNTKTLVRYHVLMEVYILHNNEYALHMDIEDEQGREKQQNEFTNEHIPLRMLDEVFSWIDRSLSKVCDEELQHIASDIRHYMLLVKNGRVSLFESLYQENMGTCLRTIRSLFTTPNTIPWTEKRESISFLLEFIKQKGRQYEHDTVTKIFSAEVYKISQAMRKEGFTYEQASYLLDLLVLARDHGIQPSITRAQEVLFPYIIGEQKNFFVTPLVKQILDHLAVALNFS